MNKLEISTLRIIGGRWRGRKITFPVIENLRPTPDRLRETLFNWFAPVIQGACCLDLFAGSGALGFEALSRGASHMTAVDQSDESIISINENIKLLSANNIEAVCAKWPAIPVLSKAPFDVVFLDPPYQFSILEECCRWLEEKKMLKPEAWIYVEFKKSTRPTLFPKNWRQIKRKSKKTIIYALFKRT